CLALPFLRSVSVPLDRRVVLAAAPVVVASFAVAIVLPGGSASATGFRPLAPGTLPPISILPSRGVQTQLDRHTARLIAHDFVAIAPSAGSHGSLHMWLEPGGGQAPPVAVVQLAGRTYRLAQVGIRWRLAAKNVSPTQ